MKKEAKKLIDSFGTKENAVIFCDISIRRLINDLKLAKELNEQVENYIYSNIAELSNIKEAIKDIDLQKDDNEDIKHFHWSKFKNEDYISGF